MKLVKKVLSVFLAVLLLSSTSALTFAAAVTHTIDASEETTIPAVDYTTATSTYKKDDVEHTVNDAISVVGNRLELAKSLMDGTTEINYTHSVTYTMTFPKDDD